MIIYLCEPSDNLRFKLYSTRSLSLSGHGEVPGLENAANFTMRSGHCQAPPPAPGILRHLTFILIRAKIIIRHQVHDIVGQVSVLEFQFFYFFAQALELLQRFHGKILFCLISNLHTWLVTFPERVKS